MGFAVLLYGGGNASVPVKPEPEHKRKHDREQRDYLAGGKADPDALNVTAPFHLESGDRVAGPAVNPAKPDLKEQWNNSQPQMVVIDDFLVPEALEILRR
jgi:hypothetical protein